MVDAVALAAWIVVVSLAFLPSRGLAADDLAGIDAAAADLGSDLAIDQGSSSTDLAMRPRMDEPRWGCGCRAVGGAAADAGSSLPPAMLVLLLAVGVRTRSRVR
jgi:hypothetical protein